MNQILSIEMKKNKEKKSNSAGGAIEIHKIVKFFAIILILFGICLIGSGSYSVYKGTQQDNTPVLTSPVIQIVELSETEIRLQVEAGVNIAKLVYSWDNGEETDIDTIGKKKVEQVITKPANKSKLYVYAKDINGKEVEQRKTYNNIGEQNSSIQINIENEENKIKITAEAETELAYMTYRWDEEDEERVEINSTQVEETINVPAGDHKLTVIVVDTNNKTKTEEKQVRGINKPTIELEPDEDGKIKVIVSAEDGISKIEYTRNDEEESTTDLSGKPIDERKRYTDRYELIEGENKIKILVYSENGATAERKIKLTK